MAFNNCYYIYYTIPILDTNFHVLQSIPGSNLYRKQSLVQKMILVLYLFLPSPYLSSFSSLHLEYVPICLYHKNKFSKSEFLGKVFLKRD